MKRHILHGSILFLLAAFVLLPAVFTACGSKPPIAGLERAIKKNVRLEGVDVGGLTESEARKKIQEHAASVDAQPRDAVLGKSTWEVEQEEQPGRKVNVDSTLRSLMSAQEGDSVKLVVEDVPAQVTSQKLNDNVLTISNYSTPLLDTTESRVNNIQISADRINGVKLAPGDEFSFNGTIGRRTEEKGYEWAPIIVRTEDGSKKGYGRGGGICQLASTLYNAAEKAGLEITERHMHSKDVGYVPEGKDATVSYGSVDLKFRNTRKYPVMIRAYVGPKTLTISFLENRN